MKKQNYKRQKTIHHRRPLCCQGSDVPENISIVPRNKHDAWHTLFSHGGDVHRVAKIINEVWIDPAYRFIVVEVVPIQDSNQLSLFPDD